MEKRKLKKLIEKLDSIRGRHTELVTVYIPAGYNIHEVISQIEQEKGTAENIKSKAVRKNVVSALDKIVRELRNYKKTPERGLALFSGNVADKEGSSDMELWAIEPPEELNTKLYWCDQAFDLEPLKQMTEEKEVYGVITLDKSEADIAFLRGKSVEVINHFDSIVPGKSKAGGQSSQRFARIREGLLHDFLKEVGSAASSILKREKYLQGVIVGGPGPIKDIFLKEQHLDPSIQDKVLGTVDVGSTGEAGVHETVNKGEHLIKESEVIKEKKVLERFFSHLQKEDKVTYGLQETIRALKMGAVEVLVLSESAPYRYVEYMCECGSGKKFIRSDKSYICPECNKEAEIVGEMDIIEAMEEETKNFGSQLEVVSSDTNEGKQFLELGGIGAILRFNIS